MKKKGGSLREITELIVLISHTDSGFSKSFSRGENMYGYDKSQRLAFSDSVTTYTKILHGRN